MKKVGKYITLIKNSAEPPAWMIHFADRTGIPIFNFSDYNNKFQISKKNQEHFLIQIHLYMEIPGTSDHNFSLASSRATLSVVVKSLSTSPSVTPPKSKNPPS